MAAVSVVVFARLILRDVMNSRMGPAYVSTAWVKQSVDWILTRRYILVAGAAALGGAVAVVNYGVRNAIEGYGPTQPNIVVSITNPLQSELDDTLVFGGQLSPAERVELRPQVTGTLTRVNFKAGDMVQEGATLFEIDPEPYRIKLNLATAALDAAKAQLTLAEQALARSTRRHERDKSALLAAQRAAQASVRSATASVSDARYDLKKCQILAPVKGKIGTHLITKGNLVRGDRIGDKSSLPPLATIVRMDPMHFEFEMTERDLAQIQHAKAAHPGWKLDQIKMAATGESVFTRQGTLEYIDDSVDPQRHTIRARATFENHDQSLLAGSLARVQFTLGPPRPVLLVPEAAILTTPPHHVLFVIDKQDTLVARSVVVGELKDELRVIRAGVLASDRVAIGDVRAFRAGMKVSPHPWPLQPPTNQTTTIASGDLQSIFR